MQQCLARGQRFLMSVACAQSMGKKCCKKNCKVQKIEQKYYLLRGRSCIHELPLDHDPILWAQLQIYVMPTNYPNAFQFIAYLKDHWTHKVTMWCVGNCNIPHARHDTNVVVESFHSNMKQIFFSSKEQFIGHIMDWLIFHLVGDVITHY